MYNLLKSDLYKLKYSKELLLSTLVVIIFGIINVMTGSDESGKDYFTREFTDWGSMIGCTLFAGMFIGKDFANRTIYHSITIGKRRLSILLSKYITYLTGCSLMIIINLLISSAIYPLVHGWGHPMDSGEIVFILTYSMTHLILNLCITSLPFMIAVLIKDTGIATAMAGVIMGGIVVLSNTFWNGIANNLSYRLFDFNTMISLIVLLFIPLIMMGITSLIFNRQDL